MSGVVVDVEVQVVPKPMKSLDYQYSRSVNSGRIEPSARMKAEDPAPPGGRDAGAPSLMTSGQPLLIEKPTIQSLARHNASMTQQQLQQPLLAGQAQPHRSFAQDNMLVVGQGPASSSRRPPNHHTVCCWNVPLHPFRQYLKTEYAGMSQVYCAGFLVMGPKWFPFVRTFLLTVVPLGFYLYFVLPSYLYGDFCLAARSSGEKTASFTAECPYYGVGEFSVWEAYLGVDPQMWRSEDGADEDEAKKSLAAGQRAVELDEGTTRREEGVAFFFRFMATLGAVVIVLEIFTAFSNPGIVPRAPGRERRIGRQLPPRLMNIRGNVVKQKWCPTCDIFRPPRSKHCSYCDNCVLRFDHHCTWLGNCIGLFNYRFYLVLIYSTTLLLAVVLVSTWHVLGQSGRTKSILGCLTNLDNLTLYTFYLFCSIAWFGVALLALYHSGITCYNLTTSEHVKNADKVNPFDMGMKANARHVWCTPERLVNEGDTAELCYDGAQGQEHETVSLD
eukprot:g2243.t1